MRRVGSRCFYDDVERTVCKMEGRGRHEWVCFNCFWNITCTHVCAYQRWDWVVWGECSAASCIHCPEIQRLTEFLPACLWKAEMSSAAAQRSHSLKRFWDREYIKRKLIDINHLISSMRVLATAKREEENNPTQKNHIDRFGFAWTEDGHSGDDPQCALWPDEELLEVISCIVFPQRGQAVQHSSIRQHLHEQHTHKH